MAVDSWCPLDCADFAHEFYGSETDFNFRPPPERHDIRQMLPS